LASTRLIDFAISQVRLSFLFDLFPKLLFGAF